MNNVFKISEIFSGKMILLPLFHKFKIVVLIVFDSSPYEEFHIPSKYLNLSNKVFCSHQFPSLQISNSNSLNHISDKILHSTSYNIILYITFIVYKYYLYRYNLLFQYSFLGTFQKFLKDVQRVAHINRNCQLLLIIHFLLNF